MNIPQQSVWRGTGHKRNFPALNRSIDTDVAIIGGGLTGIVTAYLLRNSGKRVTVLEADTLGNAATGLTTAFLLETIDTEPSQLISFFGEKKAMKIIGAHRGAISWIESTAAVESIECEFMRCPLFDYATSKKEAGEIKKEVASGKKLGVPVEFREESDVSFMQHGYAYTENQGKFHPFKFMFALADIARTAGVKIFEHTNITSLEENDRITLKHEKGEVRADHVLMATHYPEIDDDQPFSLFFKKAKYITYVFEVKRPKQSLPVGIYEDVKNPYHYIRVDAMEDHDRLLIGGEDHRADIPMNQETNFSALESYVKKIFPDGNYEIVKKWKGPIIEPGDGIAYIGPLHKESNVVYATGYSGNGMTHAVIAAHIFADIAQGSHNEYENIFTPHREMKPHVVKAKDYLGEFVHGAVKNIFHFRTRRTEE